MKITAEQFYKDISISCAQFTLTTDLQKLNKIKPVLNFFGHRIMISVKHYVIIIQYNTVIMLHIICYYVTSIRILLISHNKIIFL